MADKGMQPGGEGRGHDGGSLVPIILFWAIIRRAGSLCTGPRQRIKRYAEMAMLGPGRLGGG